MKRRADPASNVAEVAWIKMKALGCGSRLQWARLMVEIGTAPVCVREVFRGKTDLAKVLVVARSDVDHGVA